MISDTTNKMMKIKNVIFAISEATTAMPLNPRMPAIIETIRKTTTHSSIAKLAKLAPNMYKISDKTKKTKKMKKII